MPLYTYRCAMGHLADEYHTIDSIPNHPTSICPECGMESDRVFNSLGTGIIRPKGWSLKPGDKGYYDLPREAEQEFAKQWLPRDNAE